MLIQVNIDHELLKQALEASGLPSQAVVIEQGLRLLICLSRRLSRADLFGLMTASINHPPRH